MSHREVLRGGIVAGCVAAGKVLVAERTVRCAEFQSVDYVFDILHERLLGDTPCTRYRGEVAPAVRFVEARRSVDTQVGLQQVALLVVVVQTAEVGLYGPLVTAAGVVHVVDFAYVDLIVVVIEDLTVGHQVFIVVRVALGAENQFQVVAAEVVLERCQKVVVAVESARTRFGEGGIGRGGQRGGAFVVLIGCNGLLPVVAVGGRIARRQHTLQGEPFCRLVGQRDGSRKPYGVGVVAAAVKHQGYGVHALHSQTVVKTGRKLVGNVGRTGVHVVEDRALIGRGLAVVVRERKVEFHRQFVVELDVGVVAERVTLEVRIFDDAFLIHVSQRGEHAYALAAHAERNIVAVGEARTGQHGVLPVRIGIKIRVLAPVFAV